MRYLSCLLLVLLLTNCSLFRKGKVDVRYGMDNNACKKMQGKALMYLVFVDTKTTKPWSNFDLASALDSARKAAKWLEKQAKDNNHILNISVDYYGSKSKTKTISKELPKASIYESLDGLTLETSINKLNKYADDLCKKIISTAFPSQSKGSKISAREKLVNLLRDKYNVEHVALMFMFNNYYMEDFSITTNTMSKEETEYAMTSYKNPSLIASQVLSLFGAAGMGEYYLKKRNKNAKWAREQFPNDIMINAFRPIEELEIGPYTQYMIGWTDVIEKKYEKLFYIDAEKVKK
ncbi:MAG: hypothetical protein AB1458_01815 [Bacteroidota bacterium]